MNTVSLKRLIPQIGQALRAYREKRGINLSEVANKSDISVSMLSQIERGKVTPSIDTLLGVCETLGFDIADLFRRVLRQKNASVRHQGGRLKTERLGVVHEQLITSPERSIPAELLRLEISPGKSAGLSTEGHEGIEMGYILSGVARLTVGSESYDLSEGDSVAFFSHVPHTLTNNGTKPFSAIWSAIPPHKDYLESSEIVPRTVSANNDEGGT